MKLGHNLQQELYLILGRTLKSYDYKMYKIDHIQFKWALDNTWGSVTDHTQVITFLHYPTYETRQ